MHSAGEQLPDRIPEHGLRTMSGCSVLTTKLLSFSLAVMAWRSEEEMGMEKSNAPILEDLTDAPRIVDLRKVPLARLGADRKSTRLNSSHLVISYAVFCLQKK